MGTIESCLSDTVKLLIERGKEAREEDAGSDYKAGVTFGLFEAISLLHQQMQAFGLKPETLGFPVGFVAEAELLSFKHTHN